MRVSRVTASDMWAGKSGWNFSPVEFEQAHASAIVHMTATENRPNGHVGILTKDVQYGKIGRMAHASSKWGFIEVTVEDKAENWFKPKITLIREPTIPGIEK